MVVAISGGDLGDLLGSLLEESRALIIMIGIVIIAVILVVVLQRDGSFSIAALERVALVSKRVLDSVDLTLGPGLVLGKCLVNLGEHLVERRTINENVLCDEVRDIQRCLQVESCVRLVEVLSVVEELTGGSLDGVDKLGPDGVPLIGDLVARILVALDPFSDDRLVDVVEGKRGKILERILEFKTALVIEHKHIRLDVLHGGLNFGHVDIHLGPDFGVVELCGCDGSDQRSGENFHLWSVANLLFLQRIIYLSL